jgi:hypothetical protein
MYNAHAIFAVSTVLLVPFLYYVTSIPNACAVPNEGYSLSGDCTGKETDKNGKTCCWTAYEGPDKGKKVCQTCYEKTGTDGSYVQYCSPVKQAAFKSPQTASPLEPQQDLTQDRIPGGGVFKVPETNLTLSETDINSSNSSNTLSELQSDTENDNAENNGDEADESED